MSATTQKSTNTEASAIKEMVKGFKNMDMVTQGETVQRLKTKHHFKLKEIAKIVDISAPTISNLYFVIEKLPADIRKMIKDGEISGTLVLGLYRDFKDMGEQKVTLMIRKVIEMKNKTRKLVQSAGGESEPLKITKNDFNRFTKTYNSAAMFQRFAAANRADIPADKMVMFEAMNGLVEGRLNEKSFDRLFFGE